MPVAQREWAPARIALTTAVADLHETGDRTAVVIGMQCLAAIHTELREAAAAAAWLLEAIVETRRIGYGYGEVYCAWGVAFLAARCGREDDAVRMDDALADQLDAIEIGLPAVLVADYTAAMQHARRLTGTGPRASRGHGWEWLRTRALQLAGELAASPQPLGVHAAVRQALQASLQAAGSAAAAGRPPNGGRPSGGAERPIEQGHRSHGSVLHPELTARELQILAAIASGQTNPQIAKELFLSAKTVMHHSTNIYRKLGVRGRAEAVALAYREGLLSGVRR